MRARIAGSSLLLRALAALLLLSCACAKPAVKSAPSAPEPEVGPLLELLPPGPEQIALLRPRVLFEQQVVQLLWSTLVEPARERAFVERTGVDPRQLDELVAFELPNSGYVVLARGQLNARDIVKRAGERLVLLDVNSDQPVVRREGLSGAARYAYAALDGRSLLVAKNAPPQVVGALLARCRDKTLPRAIDSTDARALYQAYGTQAAVLFAPRPLALPPTSGAGLLLSEESALAVTALPQSASLQLQIVLRGVFPPGAEANFRQLVLNVAHAPLGQLLGLGEIENDLRIVQSETGVEVAFSWPAQRLALGLRTLFMDELNELMQ